MWVFRNLLFIPGIASLFRSIYGVKDKSLERSIAGITFSHPIGLAAGFDKDGKYMNAMALLGFSHLEIGTVTPRHQPGNSKTKIIPINKIQRAHQPDGI
jgi:dihydroorotate dehydrogenase